MAIQDTNYDRYWRNKAVVDKLKSVPCQDCGGTFPPYAMDFDHVRGEKLFRISGSMNRNMSKILEEIAKCELICSNCHRIRTHRRYNHE